MTVSSAFRTGGFPLVKTQLLKNGVIGKFAVPFPVPKTYRLALGPSWRDFVAFWRCLRTPVGRMVALLTDHRQTGTAWALKPSMSLFSASCPFSCEQKLLG